MNPWMTVLWGSLFFLCMCSYSAPSESDKGRKLYSHAARSQGGEDLEQRSQEERDAERDTKVNQLRRERNKLKSQQGNLNKARRAFDQANAIDDREIESIKIHVFESEALARREKRRAEAKAMSGGFWQTSTKFAEETEKIRRKHVEEWEEWKAEEDAKRDADLLEKQKRTQRKATARRRQQQVAAEVRKKHLVAFNAGPKLGREEALRQSPAWEHKGWWDKAHGRKASSRCGDERDYLLQCRGCPMQAFPRCRCEL